MKFLDYNYSFNINLCYKIFACTDTNYGKIMKYWTTEDDARIPILREKLDNFYNLTGNNYFPSENSFSQSRYWEIVAGFIRERLKEHPDKIRVLEFGAGRSAFSQFLGETRRDIYLCFHDITTSNHDYLKLHSDSCIFGDITRISENFDVIFSTFVWEHVSNPKSTLSHLLSILNNNGVLFLFSPRYDFPGYPIPSLRHYGKIKSIWISFILYLHRISTKLGISNDRFLIVVNPAVFQTKWFRDADAIHLVSLHDIIQEVSDKYTVTTCLPNLTGFKANLFESLNP